MKHKLLKTARNIAISSVVLLVIAVGGGLVYAWYSGQTAAQNPQAFADSSDSYKRPEIKPMKPNQTGAVGASIQVFTSQVIPGSNASVSVRTNPLATCVISVEYNKVSSKDSGLTQKKADEYGIVQWAWTVEATAPLGTWPVTITCANQKNSAMVRGDLNVVRTLPE